MRWVEEEEMQTRGELERSTKYGRPEELEGVGKERPSQRRSGEMKEGGWERRSQGKRKRSKEDNREE